MKFSFDVNVGFFGIILVSNIEISPLSIRGLLLIYLWCKCLFSGPAAVVTDCSVSFPADVF